MTDQLYRVQKAASGTREFLGGAMSLGTAIAHLKSIAENMQANGYLKTDRTLIRKLPIIILAKDMRTVALAVVECTPDSGETTALALADMPWLVRTVDVVNAAGYSEESTEPDIDDLTPSIELHLADEFASEREAFGGSEAAGV